VSVPAHSFSLPNDGIYSAQLSMQVLVGSDWTQVGNKVTWFI
jgi:hypothetical protein